MTGTVHPGLIFVSPCLQAELLISSTAKRCQSDLLEGRSRGQRLPPVPLVLDARDGGTFIFSESIVGTRTVARDPPNGRPSLSVRSVWDSR